MRKIDFFFVGTETESVLAKKQSFKGGITVEIVKNSNVIEVQDVNSKKGKKFQRKFLL